MMIDRQTLRRAATMTGLALVLSAVVATDARAHCDTMDGPVVLAAQKALGSGAASHVMIWVRPQDEPAIRHAFDHALNVRKLGGEARQLADLYFFETVVRLHREGEGEPYTGLKPAGTDHGPVIPAADRAVAPGDVAALETLLLHAVREGLRERLDRALATKTFAPGDVAAGRAYVAAYVPLLHYVEQVHALAAGTALGAAAGATHDAPHGAAHGAKHP